MVMSRLADVSIAHSCHDGNRRVTGSCSMPVRTDGPCRGGRGAGGPPNAHLNVGETTLAAATLRDASGNALTGRSLAWTSSEPSIATVAASGLVTALGPGSAMIIATSEGRSGQAPLTVSLAPIASVAVALAASQLAVGETTQATATLRDASGNLLTGRPLTWSSVALSLRPSRWTDLSPR